MDAAAAANGLCFPYDVLLDILRRVPGCALAASCRLVCRSWRGIVDAHGLLRPHVFPHVFVNYRGYGPESALFAPPASQSKKQRRDADEPASCQRRRLFWNGWRLRVQQHCNGLLLVKDGQDVYYVCNPATKRHARLPSPPTPWTTRRFEGMFLAFDPAVSRRHEVFCFPAQEASEERVLRAFVSSSENGEWESREFMPGRCASRHLYDVVTAPCGPKVRKWWSVEYWGGSLFVQCHSGPLMILHCSEGTYDMVQLPGHPYNEKDLLHYALPKKHVLASYDRGICYVVLDELQLQVWELTDLGEDQLGWTFAHEANLEEHNLMVNYLRVKPKMQPRMTWEAVESDKDLIAPFERESSDKSNGVADDDGTELDVEEGEEDNYGEAQAKEGEEQDNADETRNEEGEEKDRHEEYEELGSGTGSEYSWNSDEDNFVDFDKSVVVDEYGWARGIVGFHPYKDVQGCPSPKIQQHCGGVSSPHLENAVSRVHIPS